MKRKRLFLWFSAGFLTLLFIAKVFTAQNTLQTHRDVVYGVADGQNLLLDVYRPQSNTKLPAVVFVHGGGWSSGSKQDFAEVAANCARVGYVTFSLDYRLFDKDKNRFPAQLDDVQRAVRWVRAHASDYGVDASHIGAVGGSAGGHLVAFLGTRDTRDNSVPELAAYSSRVDCVIDISGPTDLTHPEKWSTVAQGIVQGFIGATIQQKPAAYKDASPVFFVTPTSAPTLIFHGTADTLVPIEQSQVFYEALLKAHVESQLVKLEGEGHGFTKPESGKLFARMALAFLKKHLKQATK